MANIRLEACVTEKEKIRKHWQGSHCLPQVFVLKYTPEELH